MGAAEAFLANKGTPIVVATAAPAVAVLRKRRRETFFSFFFSLIFDLLS
jgi:hypothetical protein